MESESIVCHIQLDLASFPVNGADVVDRDSNIALRGFNDKTTDLPRLVVEDEVA